ncbi:unnamed protein product [Larinioides sclopetarius]|uniref:Uncharacterized protein n=1 Tax=Larinioides sclopetarius TaxID=280406 RepID=A0AAV2A1N5_9ARAC
MNHNFRSSMRIQKLPSRLAHGDKILSYRYQSRRRLRDVTEELFHRLPGCLHRKRIRSAYPRLHHLLHEGERLRRYGAHEEEMTQEEF